MSALYAAVCLNQFPAQAMLRMRPDLDNRACVVIEGTPPLEQVIALNRAARASGLAASMSRAEVETVPQAVMLTRSLKEEEAARLALVACAGDFSPRIEVLSGGTRLLCVLDIAGTGMLFGVPGTLGRTLYRRLRTLRLSARMATSANFHTAIALACGHTSPDPVCVVPPGSEARALAPLPLSVLALTPEQAETCALWGVTTLDNLARLPEKELIARFGQAGKQMRLLARGEMPHLFQPIEQPFTLAEHVELDQPVELLDPLLFVANHMLEQLIQRASARALALASLCITLALEGGATHARTVRPALPSIDRRAWLKLMHLDLEAHPPAAAVLSIHLHAEPGKAGSVQLGLLAPQLPEPARLDVTLARIRALVGEENLGSPVLQDAHRPDAYRIEPFRLGAHTPPPLQARPLPTALRRIGPAENATVFVEQQRPVALRFRRQHYRLEKLFGPWQASGDWWNQARWELAEWDAVARGVDGSLLCGCIVHDCMRNQWRLAALYD